LKAVDQEGRIGKRDWARGSIGAVVSAVFGVIVSNMLMRDRNSPYAFTAKQIGRYDTESSLRDNTVANVWVSPGQRADT